MMWSLALNTPQVAPPSMVWAMYAFHWLLTSSCGLGWAPAPPCAPQKTTPTMPDLPASAHGMIAGLTPAGFGMSPGAVEGFHPVPVASALTKMLLPSVHIA